MLLCQIKTHSCLFKEIIAEACNLQFGQQQDPTEFLGALLPQLPKFGKVEEFKLKFLDKMLSCGHVSNELKCFVKK